MSRRAGLGLAWALLALVGWPAQAPALECGSVEQAFCQGEPAQFAGGFDPQVGFGGFGGAPGCIATRTPVVFVHGNGDSALGWDAPPAPVAGYPPPQRSVYEVLRARGYQDCELFGLSYLSEAERQAPQNNYHRIAKYDALIAFIDQVKAYTGLPQVDLVTHSLGVSTAIAALDYHGQWGSVRRFINIAGGIRGLDSCYLTGFYNPVAPTCYFARNQHEFGFFPEGWYWLGGYVFNRWTGSGRDSLRRAPERAPAVLFYTLHAGKHDEVHCTGASLYRCARGALFAEAPNVRAQLNVGTGSTTDELDWDWQDGLPSNLAGGDRDGVGHFRARSNTGVIIQRMLGSECRGLECAAGYGAGPVAED